MKYFKSYSSYVFLNTCKSLKLLSSTRNYLAKFNLIYILHASAQIKISTEKKIL